MAGEEYYLPPVAGESAEEVRDSVNTVLAELNTILRTIETKQAQIAGNRGLVPTFGNNLDLGGFRATNAGHSRTPDDLVTRRELQNQGLYQPNPGRPLVTKIPIVARGGIRIPRGGGGAGSDAVIAARDLTTAVDFLQTQIDAAEADILALSNTLDTIVGLAMRSTESLEEALEEMRVMRAQMEFLTGEELGKRDVKELE